MQDIQPQLADLWAKTDANGLPSTSVAAHCLHVGSVAEVLLGLLPHSTRSIMPSGGVSLAAAHDIGKISPGFQLKCPAWRERWQTCLQLPADGHETRHAWSSQKFLAGCYTKPPRWLMAVGGHHGRYLCAEAKPASISQASIGQGIFEDLRRELFGMLVERFGQPPPEESVPKGARLHWFTGSIIFCDWIGSNTSWFPPHADSGDADKLRAQATDALDEVGIHRHGVASGKAFHDLFGFEEPRPLQKKLIEAMDSPGLYIVEAPMGDGKTEAALAGAYRRWTQGGERGLYFALPTQLTSNRIRDRVEDFIQRIVAEESALALVHGSAWLSGNRIRPLDPQPFGADKNEADNASESNRWFSDSRRSMLAPFGVGTIDQALMAVVPVKYSALRMFGLGGKVVVIDEVHSYDPFTSALVDRLVKWLIEIGGTVVVLSATLTAARRASLVEAAGAQEQNAPSDYPLVTKVASGSSSAVHFSIDGPRPTERRVSIETRKANDDCWMTEVAHAANQGACVLVIRNTVDLARESYCALKAHCPDTGIEFGLIHSRFTQGDRDKNETRWTNLLGRDGSARPRRGAILIGTQVLEQSLDIDADLLVTDLAPTDLILQRIGRLHRHTRQRPPGVDSPRCILLRPDVDWNASLADVEAALSPHRFIYPPFALFMADMVWTELASITLPSGIRPVLEKSAIEPASLPPSVREFIDAMNHQTTRMRQAAWLNGIFKAPAVGDAEGAETRWNMQPTAWIVVLSRQPARSGHKIEVAFPDSTTRKFDESAFDFPLARALQLHAVRIPAWLVRGLQSPAWLKTHLPDAVLAVKDETNRITLCAEGDVSHEFTYSQETGLGFAKIRNDTRYRPEEEDSWY